MTRETRNMLIGEVLGTYLITLIGTGAVATAVLIGAQVGLGQVAAVWWAGVTIAIFFVAAIRRGAPEPSRDDLHGNAWEVPVEPRGVSDPCPTSGSGYGWGHGSRRLSKPS